MTRSPWLRVYVMQLYSPFSDSVSLRLRDFHHLTSLHNVTRRLILQKARCYPCGLQHLVGFMVSGSISLPLQGFFSPFPHGTCSLSVAAEYLALDRGRPRFRQGFSCPALLRYRIKESLSFRIRGFHALRQAFPDLSAMKKFYPNSSGHPHAALQPHL